MNYKLIDRTRAEDVAKLAVCLTNEIIERTGIKHFDVDVPLAIDLCDKFIANGQYTVIAAFDREI